MLRLIPSGSPSKTQLDSPESLSPQLLSATQFKRNSLLNLGFQGNDADNNDRKRQVRRFFEDFNKKLQVLRKNGVPITIKEKMKENSEPLYAILDSIFSLYNINIHIINQDQSDSAIRIEPTLHMGRAVQCLVSVAVVLSKFPYSFIKLIDLNKFTICKRAQLKKGNYEELYASRILTNAMFMLDVHDTHEKIENFFYKVVLHHAKKKVPEIHTEWPIDRSPKHEGSRSGKTQSITFSFNHSNHSTLSSPRLSSPRTKSPTLHSSRDSRDDNAKTFYDEIKEKEELEVFSKIIAEPRETFDSNNVRLQIRANFLKAKLEFLDSVGICKEWWEDLAKSTVGIAEDAKEFSIKL